MFEDFIFDLKVTRKQSGLTQADAGHLIGGSGSKISQLETGSRLPTVREICALSLIYGRNFESLFGEVMQDVRRELGDNLATLPESRDARIGSFQRKNTLAALADRLSEGTDITYGG